MKKQLALLLLALLPLGVQAQINGGGPNGPPSICAGSVPTNSYALVYNSTLGCVQWTAVGSGSGSVTSVSVVSANGLGGTVATATSTPAITLTTSITGPLKGNGTALQAASSSDILGLFPSSLIPTTNISGLAAVATSGSASDLSAGTLAAARMPLGITATPTAGQLLLGNAGGTAYAAVSMSGDATIGSTGAITVSKFNGGTTFGTLAGQSGTFSGTSSGTNTGDQTITLTGAVTGSGTGSFATTYAGTQGVATGGTNISSYAIGDMLYASGSTTLSKLADVAVGSYLRSGGVTTAPVWSTLVLPNAATQGDLIVATGSNTLGSVADVATGSVLTSGGVGTVPAYATTIPNSMITGGTTSGATAWVIGATLSATGFVPTAASCTNTRMNIPATQTMGLCANSVQIYKSSSTLTSIAAPHTEFAPATFVTSSALSGCGTSPTINATATDTKGTITEGTTATGCVLTFLTAYASAPDCVVSSPSGILPTSYTTSTTTLTIVNASATGDKFTYHCFQ